MRRCLPFAVALLAIFGAVVPAVASDVTWNITGTFDDGGKLSGSFVFNADTSQYSSIDVTTTTGTTRNGADYSFSDPCCGEIPFFLLFTTTDTGDLTGTPVLSIDLGSSMTDAGGTIPFAIGAQFFGEESCIDSACGGPATPERLLTSGSVTAAVPEPSNFGLLGIGLVGIATAMRRKLRA